LINLSRNIYIYIYIYIYILIRRVNTLTDKKPLEKLKTAVFLQHVGLAVVKPSHQQEHSPTVHDKWTPRVLSSQIERNELANTFTPSLLGRNRIAAAAS